MTHHQPITALPAAELGVALNEANLLSIEVDVETAAAAVLLRFLRCHHRDPSRVTAGVARAWVGSAGWRCPIGTSAGTTRMPPVAPLRLERLSEVIGAFRPAAGSWLGVLQPGEAPFVEWCDRLSLDVLGA
jgi:hypothetical protein